MSEVKNIPKHWQVVKLGDYVISVKGKKPKRVSPIKTRECSIPYVNIKAFEKNVIDEYTDGLGCVLCEKDDFLMVWDGSRSGYVGKAINGALGSTLVKLKFPNIDTNYAYYFLQSKFIEINTRAKGVGIPHVDPIILWNYMLPIPPLPEQHTIVSKIEELLSDLDNGKQQLLTAQQQLKVYRQSLLKWAFEGRFGFAQRPPNSVKEGELPEGWKWVRLGEIAEVQTLKALPKDLPDAKFIGMDCIEPHTLKPSFTYQFSEFKSTGNYFKTGQVLYGRMRPYLNKVYRAEYDGTCSGEFIILQCKEIFNPDLLKYILHSKGFVSFANHKTSGDRPRISYDEIAEFSIALPPIEEQQLIVDELESKLTVCDKIAETISQSLLQAETLRQSILKKAFEGKLA